MFIIRRDSQNHGFVRRTTSSTSDEQELLCPVHYSCLHLKAWLRTADVANEVKFLKGHLSAMTCNNVPPRWQGRRGTLSGRWPQCRNNEQVVRGDSAAEWRHVVRRVSARLAARRMAGADGCSRRAHPSRRVLPLWVSASVPFETGSGHE